MKCEYLVLNEERNVSLTCYLQEVGGEFHYVKKRPAVLIIPGGGYQFCSDREADPVAMPYLKAGYQAFILRYSVAEHQTWPNPLEDYEEAMSLIRRNAEKWNLYPDKIAAVGFSAGGHLAAAAASMSENRPNAAILGYPVICGDILRMCSETAPDVSEYVDRKTCPCFVFSSRTDNLVPIENSVKFIQALVQHDISFESHFYAYGPHGYSTGDPSVQDINSKMCSRLTDWVEDSIAWLKDVFGEFCLEGLSEPACPAHTNADSEAVYSIACSFDYLKRQEAALKCVRAFLTGPEKEPYLKKLEAFAAEYPSFAASVQTRDLLNMIELPEKLQNELDLALRKTPKK